MVEDVVIKVGDNITFGYGPDNGPVIFTNGKIIFVKEVNKTDEVFQVEVIKIEEGSLIK